MGHLPTWIEPPSTVENRTVFAQNLANKYHHHFCRLVAAGDGWLDLRFLQGESRSLFDALPANSE